MNAGRQIRMAASAAFLPRAEIQKATAKPSFSEAYRLAWRHSDRANLLGLAALRWRQTLSGPPCEGIGFASFSNCIIVDRQGAGVIVFLERKITCAIE